MSRDPGPLVESLRTVFEDGRSVRLAILFGSHARGGARPDSDVDVGIIPRDPEMRLADELELQARCERMCGQPIDLVRLDHASPLLRWEAARNAVSYAESFAVLAAHGVLDPRLADALARTVVVRNRLAHGYAAIDLERLWTDLPDGLDALDRYASAIARFLPPAR